MASRIGHASLTKSSLRDRLETTVGGEGQNQQSLEPRARRVTEAMTTVIPAQSLNRELVGESK